MICTANDCGRNAVGLKLCQKHYFRLRRNGTTDYMGMRAPDGSPHLRAMRKENQKGYQMLYEPTHPLAMKDGFVYEHRKVVYERYGDALPDCEICGAPTNWLTCHVDHRDESVANNAFANLRPVCRGCNTSRTRSSTTPRFEMDGETLTLTEWVSRPGVQVGRAGANGRLKAGMTLREALFAPNPTHPRL